MIIKQLYTNCLAEAAYYVESGGEAAVIDPLREITEYLELAEKNKAKIKYVFETHFHADFVSGHIDLAKKANAKIVFGPEAHTDYEKYTATDGEVFQLGKLKIQVLHTPGHTPESTCYLLFDESGKEHALFSGDTLFVGAVGRPDLLDGKMSKEELAGMMYESLHGKIAVLPDDVLVYPAHGPGSQCGKGLGAETWSTIGEQKKKNYALQNMSKEEFIKVLTDDMPPPPAYFFQDARINKSGYTSIDKVLENNSIALSINKFEEKVNAGAMILDTRHPNDFAEGFIPNSINIGLNGTFAVWVGTLLDIDQPIVLVTEQGKEEESILRLARVGYEKVEGYLKDGMDAWKAADKQTDYIPQVSVKQLQEIHQEGQQVILDVRTQAETEDGYVEGAKKIPLNMLNDHYKELSQEEKYVINCRSGYRSMIAASMLKAKGITKVANVLGGFNDIKTTSIPQVKVQ